jgi:hypothetical protein
VLVSDQASMNCGSSAGIIENPARPRISAAHMTATTGVDGAAVAGCGVPSGQPLRRSSFLEADQEIPDFTGKFPVFGRKWDQIREAA